MTSCEDQSEPVLAGSIARVALPILPEGSSIDDQSTSALSRPVSVAASIESNDPGPSLHRTTETLDPAPPAAGASPSPHSSRSRVPPGHCRIGLPHLGAPHDSRDRTGDPDSTPRWSW